MYGSRFPVELLEPGKAGHGVHDLPGREFPARPNHPPRPRCFRVRMDATQAAARRSRDLASPPLQPVRIWFVEPDPKFDTIGQLKHLKGLNVAGTIDDAFVEAEAESEILEIQRRRHHHGV